MRKFAFALLLFGFVWLCAAAFVFDWTTDRVSAARIEALPRQNSFTRDEVIQQISFAFPKLVNRAPWLILPGGVMLAAGLLLGITSRPAKASKPSEGA